MSLDYRYSALKEKVRLRKEVFDILMRFVETHTVYISVPTFVRYHRRREKCLLEQRMNARDL